MFEKMYARNLMDSLFNLFIFIRFDPMNAALFQLLHKYQYWLHKDLSEHTSDHVHIRKSNKCNCSKRDRKDKNYGKFSTQLPIFYFR